MTAGTPQPDAANTAPPSAQEGAARQPAGNQQLRIAILVIVAAVVGIGLWLVLGHHSKKATTPPKASGPTTTAVAPVSLTESQLKARAAGSKPFYWIGPKKGFHYEYSRLTNGSIYLRYLPKGVAVRGKPGKLPIIVTFPYPHAYARLKAGAHGSGVKGPDGSFVWVGSDYPKAAYVAWPHVPYEVEVYNPNPRKAARIAKSGNVAPVG